jgi:photosystem II stability/assembly factor-like uncharacterized protein
MRTLALVAFLAALCLTPATAVSQTPAVEDSAFMASFRWRSIGPANMSGRVTDIEGVPGSKTFYVAAASGGIWKTTNNGTTFRPLFDDQRVVAMGDLAIAPSDTSIVWAGTGEEDSRNSISPGGGVYKSTDGGMSWTLMGLEDTHVIGRIVVHPTNPDIAYVAALGHIWGPNEERGLYRTTDGGESWEQIKYMSDKAGFVDIAMHPTNPNILFASSWERVRGPWFLQSGGPGSALWKSTDGGDTWTEVKGGGFPETMKGRIGIAIAHSDPDVMYAVVEAEAESDDAEAGEEEATGEEAARGEAAEGEQAQEESAEKQERVVSGLYHSDDGGVTWEFMSEHNNRPFYYSQVRVDPTDPNHVYWSSTPVRFSKDGGKTLGTATIGIHVDHHALWWDTEDPDHFIGGNDGGVAITWDRGGNYDFVNTEPLGQFYAVSYSMEIPYRVCGGLQDNGTWCGPSRRADGPITSHMWATINGGDGFYAPQHPVDADIVYAESQRGNVALIDLGSGEREGLEKPDWRTATRELRDSLVVLQADSIRAGSPEGQARLTELRERISADSAALELRYNWSTPLVLSPHDPEVLYIGASRVLRWTTESEEMVPISPDLTTADTMKIRISTKETGGITPDLTGAEFHSTITALAEAPLRQGLLYAGTDDGNVWMSPNGGDEWIELMGRFDGVPPNTWVSRIEPSNHDAERFFVSFDGHRSDDFTPYVFVTDDGGDRFRSITAGLPSGGPDYVHVIREDPHNPNLLFVGTDVGVYASLDRGESWQRFMSGLPTVPVHDLKIHPRDGELIAGTHGRSIWIVDIAPLEQMVAGTLPDSPIVLDSKPALQFGDVPMGGESAGHKSFRGTSTAYGAEIAYWVPEQLADEIAEATRAEMRERMLEARDAAREAGDAGKGGGGRSEEGAPRARRSGAPSAREMLRARREQQAKITILGPAGDTILNLRGTTRAGLNRVTWNLRHRSARAEPLSTSGRQDSVRALEVERVLEAIETGDREAVFGGLRSGRGGPGGSGRFVERPAENYPRQPSEAAERTEGAEAAEAAGEPAEPDEREGATEEGEQETRGEPSESDVRDARRQIFRAVRRRGLSLDALGFGGGFGGAGGPEPVEPGRYAVIVEIGERRLTGSVEVLRAPGFGEE